MKQAEHYPSTSNPEARYDAVVARGRSLERSARRRRTLVSTGVAALVVVLVGAAVFGALNTGDASQGPAGPATTGAPTTQPGPTTATTPLRISATTVDGAVAVQLDRSAAPVPAGTRACVHVRMQPAGRAQVATAESTACWNPADGDAVTEVELTRTVGAEVGCAASTGDASVGADGTDGAPVTLERGDGTGSGSTTTVVPQAPSADAALQHSFRFRLPKGLPAGSYVAEATAVVGTGDGCPTSTPGDDEEVATASTAVNVA